MAKENKHGPCERVVFRGEIFRRYPQSPVAAMRRYYFAQHGRSLHRAKWEALRGPIPDGHHIHHKNGNHLDNRIANLECIDGGRHISEHMLRPESRERSRIAIRKAIAAAPAWHASPDGIAWHREHAKRIAARQPLLRLVCSVCGGGFESKDRAAAVCSGRCHAKRRRDSGVDDREFNCVECGEAFTRNRYQRGAGFCGRSCATRAANRRRGRGVQPDRA